MLKNSIPQAENRLIEAKSALQDFKAAIDCSDIKAGQRHWARFLGALGAVYTKLEQGAKCCGHCSGWWGREKKTRRTDPLLQYLHQARNTDLHGLEEVTVVAPQRLDIKDSQGQGVSLKFAYQEDAQPGPVRVTVGDGKGNEIDITSSLTQIYHDEQFTLLKVSDKRFGDTF